MMRTMVRKRLYVAAAAALILCLCTPALATYNGVEVQTFTNISSTTPSFTLRGGQYAMTVHATFGGGSVTLQRLAADNATWVNCLTAFAADAYATVNLPSGTYRVAIATASGVYLNVTSVVTVQ
jgi:hypothetical protein